MEPAERLLVCIIVSRVALRDAAGAANLRGACWPTQVLFYAWFAKCRQDACVAREQFIHTHKDMLKIFLSATYAHALETFLGILRRRTPSSRA
jgi:hypothetical protein